MIYHFPELESTNLWMKGRAEKLEDLAVVTADYQTAGRGQRGNGWESATGDNLLMSMLFCPQNLKAQDQFRISKMISVAIFNVVVGLLPAGTNVKIKWPNDIYVNDKKVCGILIENSISQDGKIQHAIIGIGLNLNQREFKSGAPNPASLVQFMSAESGRLIPSEIAEMIVEKFRELRVVTPDEVDFQYMSSLRGVDCYLRYAILNPSASPAPTALTDGSGNEIIEATIEGVAPDGRLDMLLRDGSRRSFYFKEITPLL